MIGAARITLLTCVVGLLAGILISTVGAQTEESSAQTQPTAPPTETFGAPPELQAVAAEVDRLLRERRFAEARAICQQGYDSATDDATRALALRGIGETYKEDYLASKAIKVFQQAIETFQQVIQQYPQSDQVSWAKLGIAECYVDQAEVADPEENIAVAMPMLEQFLKDYPNHERAEWALKYRGWCYERLGNDEAALAEYLKAPVLYPKHRWTPICLRSAIVLQQKMERWEDAIATAGRYLQLFPDCDPVNAQLTMGFSYAGKGDLATAIQEFDKVVSQYPIFKGQCAMALFQKGLSQKALGQLAAARQTLAQLAQTYPDDYLAVQAKQQLELMGAE